MDGNSRLRAFVEEDGDLSVLAGRTVGVIGFGSQGRAQALNLRDSGVDRIIVGTRMDESREQAARDGFTVSGIREAAIAADVLLLLIPDEDLPEVFAEQIAPHLQSGNAVVLASGYGLAFAGLSPPPDIDVLLLAPRMIGRQMRQLYARGDGFYSYVSVEHDASGGGWPLVLALAKGIGSLRRGGGAFELDARTEAVLDLYHEQAFGSVLGVSIALLLEVGATAGIPAEALALDLYLSGEVAESLQAAAEVGFYEQSRLHSLTSQYGGMMRALEMDRASLRAHFTRILDDVQSGEFARRWHQEREGNYSEFEQLRELARQANPFTPIERRVQDALARARDEEPAP
jgi:ketol-acid reductoisomerase